MSVWAGPRRIAFMIPGPLWIWVSASLQKPLGILRLKCQQFPLLNVTNVNITNQICCCHESDGKLLISFHDADVLDRKSAPCHCWLIVEMMCLCLSGIFNLPQSFRYWSSAPVVLVFSLLHLTLFGKVETMHFNYTDFSRFIHDLNELTNVLSNVNFYSFQCQKNKYVNPKGLKSVTL